MGKEIKTVNNRKVEILTDVPPGDVDRIIKDYKNFDGVTDVKKEKQENGMFKITATFPA